MLPDTLETPPELEMHIIYILFYCCLIVMFDLLLGEAANIQEETSASGAGEL